MSLCVLKGTLVSHSEINLLMHENINHTQLGQFMRYAVKDLSLLFPNDHFELNNTIMLSHNKTMYLIVLSNVIECYQLYLHHIS